MLPRLLLAVPRVPFRVPARTFAAPAPAEAPQAENDPKIVPDWTNFAILDPNRYMIDCQNRDLSGGPQTRPDIVAKMHKSFSDVGLVLLRNTGLQGHLDLMGEWAAFLSGGKTEKYEGGANSRGEIDRNVYDVGAPTEAYLHYHHEMAYLHQSVQWLGFCASTTIKTTPEEPFRGMTFLSENIGATKDLLSTEFGQKLKNRGICYIRCLTDRDGENRPELYNHWQTSFGVENPAEVEKLCKKKGLYFEWGPGRFLRTKFYVSGFEFFPHINRNLLYSSIADHGSWFDTWPGVKDLPDMDSFETATPDVKPLKITFGDNSRMSVEELQLFADVYDRNGFAIPWQSGDIAVVCNYRFAHGRPEFKVQEDEQRILGVVLGGMYDRLGQVEGKW